MGSRDTADEYIHFMGSRSSTIASKTCSWCQDLLTGSQFVGITFTAAQVLFSSTLPPEMNRMPLVLSFLHKKHLGLVCTASGYYVTAHFGTLLTQGTS